MQRLNFPRSQKLLWGLGAGLVLLFALAYYALLPVAEVMIVQRGTAIAAVYGTVRIEPTLVIPVRAQNAGFIRLADPFSAGRAAIGKGLQKEELLATIADETTARQLKQARTRLRELSLKVIGDSPISTESMVKFGKPFHKIAQVAKDEAVDLIIIATHGFTGLKHIQLGSTAEMVVRYAPCPVLVLPNRARAEGAGKG